MTLRQRISYRTSETTSSAVSADKIVNGDHFYDANPMQVVKYPSATVMFTIRVGQPGRMEHGSEWRRFNTSGMAALGTWGTQKAGAKEAVCRASCRPRPVVYCSFHNGWDFRPPLRMRCTCSARNEMKPAIFCRSRYSKCALSYLHTGVAYWRAPAS
jgi:hypothetical protein